MLCMSDIHAARRNRVRAALADRGFDAVLISSLVNVRYLSGFTGSNAALLLGPTGGADDDTLATDKRYAVQAAEQAGDLPSVIERGVGPALVKAAAAHGARRIGYESHIVTVDGLRALTDAAEHVELATIERTVEAVRTVKDATEIEALRTACVVADRAFGDLLTAGGVRPGRTERGVARDLDARMAEHGAHAISFDTIIAAGPNSAIPHHEPTDRPLASGDLCKCDFGAMVDGYHSDMTRTVVLGPPADWQRELYELVASAQRAGVRAVTPGAALAAVDDAARSVITAGGYGAEFTHGLGHGVGLEIHEAPFFAATATGTLATATAVTVEPGVYLPGRGGVRIEDTLVVREPAMKDDAGASERAPEQDRSSGTDRAAGGAQLLTATTKELIVL